MFVTMPIQPSPEFGPIIFLAAVLFAALVYLVVSRTFQRLTDQKRMRQLAEIYDKLASRLVLEGILLVEKERATGDYLWNKSQIQIRKDLLVEIDVVLWPKVSVTSSQYWEHRSGSMRFSIHYPDSPVQSLVEDTYGELRVLPNYLFLEDLVNQDIDQLALKIAHAVRTLDFLWHHSQKFSAELQRTYDTEDKIENSVRAIVNLPPAGARDDDPLF